jgi:hypothetical protein
MTRRHETCPVRAEREAVKVVQHRRRLRRTGSRKTGCGDQKNEAGRRSAPHVPSRVFEQSVR